MGCRDPLTAGRGREIKLNNLTEWLSGNPYLNLLFLVLAIASVATSIFLYLKGKKSKEPTYLAKSFAIIDDHISAIAGLEIKYRDQDVQRLTISKLSFWNGGHETIDGSDIAPADKLRFVVEEDGEIISAKPILEKRQANNITISIQDNEAHVLFDFFDYGDGAIFEIYHTGSAKLSLKMNGTIKGVKKIQYGEYQKDYLLDKVTEPLFGWTDKLNLKDGSFSHDLLMMVLVPFIIPFIIVLSPIDKIGSYFRRIPKEYDLSGIETPNKALQPTSLRSAAEG